MPGDDHAAARSPSYALARRGAPTCAWWVVLLGYALFGIYATWPALPDLWRGFALGDDPSVSAWGLWWTKEALLALDNPWYTRLQAAPEGVYLSFHALVPLAGFLLSPLTALLGPGVTLGLTKLALPPLSAFIAHRAGLRIGLRFWPAIAAGGLYGFATLIVWKTTFHFNFGFGALFLPLAVLWAARAQASGSRRDWAGLGIVGGAAVLVDPFIATLVAVVAATFLFATRAISFSKAGIVRLALAATVALAVAAPQLWMTAKARSEDQYTVAREGLATSWVTYNASIDTLVSPGNVRPLVPGTLELWSTRHDGDGGSSAYGWGLLALALTGIVLTRRRTAPHWWAIGIAALGSLLALGPEFTVSETPAIPLPIERHGHELSAVMPYTWLVQLPVFEDFRVAARFTELAVLGLAFAAGFGIQTLWSRGWLRMVGVALLALAVLEAGWPDGGRNRVTVPFEKTALYEPVRADQSQSTLIDLPYGLLGAGAAAFGSQMPGNEFMLRAPEHGHAIVGGWVTRLSARRVSVAVRHRLLVDLAVLQSRHPPPGAAFNVAPPPTTPVDARAGRIDADRLQLRWAVVWPTANPALLPYLRQIGFREVRRDGPIALMRR